jgi:hypothetical protein
VKGTTIVGGGDSIAAVKKRVSPIASRTSPPAAALLDLVDEFPCAALPIIKQPKCEFTATSQQDSEENLLVSLAVARIGLNLHSILNEMRTPLSRATGRCTRPSPRR